MNECQRSESSFKERTQTCSITIFYTFAERVGLLSFFLLSFVQRQREIYCILVTISQMYKRRGQGNIYKSKWLKCLSYKCNIHYCPTPRTIYEMWNTACAAWNEWQTEGLIIYLKKKQTKHSIWHVFVSPQPFHTDSSQIFPALPVLTL